MKKHYETVYMFLLCGIIIALCAFSVEAKAGALEGIRLCEEIIIPSLLPVLIICNIIIISRASLGFEFIFGRLFEKVFKLPRAAAGAVILGLIGGYPTGAVLTHRLYISGAIDEKTASRIMHFNLCGGCAFIITAVGTVTYSSTKIGLLLYFCILLSSLIILALSGIKHSLPPQVNEKRVCLNLPDALCEAVEATVKALAVMSAYIVLFSAFCAVVRLPYSLTPIFEITNGICKADALLPLPYCAFFLSFGGLCIHLQLFGFLRQMKVKYPEFLTYRMLSALISFLLMKLYVYFFPESAEVFSNLSSPSRQLSSEGLAISLVMIIGCAVVIFDIENRKLKLL